MGEYSTPLVEWQTYREHLAKFDGQDPSTGKAEEEAEGLETIKERDPSINPNVKSSQNI